MKTEVFNIINNANFSIESRKQSAEFFIRNPEYISDLVLALSEETSEIQLKILMILEVLSRENLVLLSPFINEIVNKISTANNTSEKRLFSKIIHFVLNYEKIKIEQATKDLIIGKSFDWLLTEKATAVQVFSMQNIYDLKAEADWIAPELQAVLENQLPGASAGFHSRAVKILKKLKQ